MREFASIAEKRRHDAVMIVELRRRLVVVRDSLRGLVSVPPETVKHEIGWINDMLAYIDGKD